MPGKNKNLISISELAKNEIEKIFSLARQSKKNPKQFQGVLQGKKIGLIFEKPSTRTWVSFDVGVFSLGGGTIYLGPDDIKLGVREEIRDVARVLRRYLQGLVIRTYSHDTIVQFQKYFNKPVINGLSDWEHPCQALADHFTIREHLPKVAKPKIAFIGDGNNVLNSHLLLCAKLGGQIVYATPKKHEPSRKIVLAANKIAKSTRAKIEKTYDPKVAVKDADIVYTDVWVSMGQEKQRQKKIKEFKGMQVNAKLLKLAKKTVKVMHCLPAHRGEEITNDVLESKKSIVFDQAENRLHIQRAILLHLFS